MKTFLVLALFFGTVSLNINGFEINPKFGKSKSLEILSVNKGSGVDAPYCNSLVAHFGGILQNNKSNETYDVEFQIKIWTDEEKKKIHVYADNWNEDFSSSQDFELDFMYEDNRQWCDIYDNDCASKFGKNSSSFRLDLNHKSGNYFHLLYFQNFNNSFGLHNPIGKCTKRQLDNLRDDWTPDLDQFSICLCCDTYQPNGLLGCPYNKWDQPTTTLPPPTPSPQDLKCKSVISYHSGVFKNNGITETPVQFQTRLSANDLTQRVYYQIDHWNKTLTNIRDVALWAGVIDNGKTCHQIESSNCSNPYVDEAYDFYVYLEKYSKGEAQTEYLYLKFPSFDNSFTVTNAIGRCTKNQVQDKYDGYQTNSTFYEYCVCCGDKYDPHPALGCPKNPWA